MFRLVWSWMALMDLLRLSLDTLLGDLPSLDLLLEIRLLEIVHLGLERIDGVDPLALFSNL